MFLGVNERGEAPSGVDTNRTLQWSLGSDLKGRFQEIIIGCSASRELRRCRI